MRSYRSAGARALRLCVWLAAFTGLTARPASGDSRVSPDPLVPPGGVSVTPTNGAGPDRFADSSGFTAQFTVTNTGTSTNTYTLTCYGTNIVCTDQSATVATLTPGSSLIVTVTYNTTSAIGTSWVRLSAEGTMALGTGAWKFTAWAKVPHAAIVTPVSATAPNRTAFTSGYTAAFTVKNVGLVRDTFNLFCQPAGNVSCTSQTLTITPGLNAFDSSNVTITYATGASGPGFIALQAGSASSSATGSWSFTVAASSTTAVAVTPDGQAVGVLVSASASRPFTVRNPGTASSTYNMTVSCTGAAIVGTCTRSPTALTLASGASGTVTVGYTSGGTGTTGKIVLTATHSVDLAVKDTGWVTVATGTAQPATVVVADSGGGTLARGLCLAVALGDGAASECGDLRLAHALPAMRTLGKTRVPMLEYSSATAHPYPLVAGNVTLPTGAANPDSIVVRLLVASIQKAKASWSGSGMSPGRASRVVIGYDALTDTNGVYSNNYTVINNYTLEVVSWYGTAAQPTQTTTGQYVIVNRKNSPFGAGWWLAGLEQLNTSTKVWTGGDGSVRQYTAVATQPLTNCVTGQPSPSSNVYVAPKVDHPDTLKFDGGCYTRYLPGGAKVVFNALGRDTATVNRLGHTTRFHYRASGLAAGLLDTITVPPTSAAARYVFVYDTTVTPKRIKAVVAPPAGAVARVDSITMSVGKVTAIRDPDSTTVNFAYDASVTNRAISRTDRRGTVTNFTFDAGGKATGSTVDPSGLAITTTVRALQSKGFTNTPLGSVVDTALAYALLDGPRTDVGDSTLFWLDRFGAPRRIRNALGAETVLRRDSTWLALVTRVQSPNGRVVRATYDTRGHVKTVTDSGTIVNGQVATTRYEWNMTWDAVERIVPPEQDSMVIFYNSTNGNRLWQQDGRGSMSRVNFGYSSTTGLLTSIRLPAAVKADSFHYDAVRNNLDSTWTPIGFRTVTFTDALGRDTLLITPIDSAQVPPPNNKVKRQRIVYNLADGVKQTTTTGPAMPYQLDLATSFVPDTMPVAAETLVVTNGYDPEGNLNSVVSVTTLPNYGFLPIRVSDFRLYDAANRLVSQQLGSGPSSFNYDPAGNPIGLGYQNGTEVAQTFDALNRLAQRVVPQVDEAQTTCAGHITMPYTYPICGLRFPLYPNNGTGYRIAADTNTFTYDVMGNLLTANSRDAKISRTYYLNGAIQSDTQRLRAIVGTTFPYVYGIRYGYDRNGRRTWVRLPLVAGDSMTYTYSSALGALTQIRDPQGRLFAFAYDSAGRLDTLLTYPGAGQPWGIRETTIFDADARVIRRVRASNGGTGDTDSLRYDARGKVIEARIHDAAAGHTNERITLAYDGLGAVVGSEVYNVSLLTWQSEEYRNDGLGNVWWNKSITATGAEFPHWSKYSIPTGALTLRDEVPATCTSDAFRRDTLAQTFDNAGNVRNADQANRHCIVSNQGYSRQVATRNYYRGDNRLMVVQRYGWFENNDQDGTWEEYRYDALGRRVVIHALRDSLCHSFSATFDCSNFDQFTVWDGDQILGEVRTAPLATLWYVHGAGLDRPLEILDSRGGMDGRVPLYDWRGLGQASRWTNGTPADASLPGQSSPTISWPAGAGVYYLRPPQQVSGPLPTWVGSLVANGEDGTRLLYRRNRYFDPASGRFTQEDPIGIAGGLNLYGFANGDPVNFSDPFGLCPWHDIECWEDKMWAASQGTGFVGRVLAPLGSTALELTGLASVDRAAKDAAGGSTAGAVALTAEFVFAAVPGGRQGITIGRKAVSHIVRKHGAQSLARNSSKFGRGVNIEKLVQAAEDVTPTVAANGNLVRVVDAGSEIGVDRATGQATSVYTVVTDPNGKLITAHPGGP